MRVLMEGSKKWVMIAMNKQKTPSRTFFTKKTTFFYLVGNVHYNTAQRETLFQKRTKKGHKEESKLNFLKFQLLKGHV